MSEVAHDNWKRGENYLQIDVGSIIVWRGINRKPQIEGQTNINAQLEMHKKTNNVWQIY
jgi:hypothetical protein